MRISKAEQEMYGHIPFFVRQFQYAKATALRVPNPTQNQLRKAVVWKFGFCALKRETLGRIIKEVNEVK